jgi:hypothetical protein
MRLSGEDLVYMIMDIGRNFSGRNVVIVVAEWVFNFFCDHFQTGQYIKYKGNNGYHIIAENKHISKGQGHNVEKDEFLNEHTVGKRDWSVFNSFAGATDIGERLHFCIEKD